MIDINYKVLKNCADNLKFELEDEQIDLLLSEFKDLLAQMDFLSHIEGIDNVEPMTFPYHDHLTEDDLGLDEKEEPEKAEVELSNTKNRLGNQVKIPKVLG